MNKTILKFVKYSGNGNDFVIIDHSPVPVIPSLVTRLCDRHFGIGADGVLTLTSREGCDGEMRIFNADGGEAEMCGNGLRCLATYLDDVSTLKKQSYKIKTMNNTYSVVRSGDSFGIEMSELKDRNLHDLSGFTGFLNSFFINTGVPHLVFQAMDIKSIDMKLIAPKYRFHKMFPGGTNVSFVEILDSSKQSTYVRTYERGVEDETYSCGTGLTACGLALSQWFGWKGEIRLSSKGGQQTVNIGEKVLYSGEVFRCFKGEIEI